MNRHTTATRLRVARTMRHSQRGAAVIMTAGFMLLGVLCLALAVDTGRLYMEKRSLQRMADTMALELASRQVCSNRDANGVPLDLNTFMGQARARGGVSANANVQAFCGTYNAIAAEDRCIAATGFSTFIPGAGNDVQVVVTENGVRASMVAGGIFGGTLNIPACAVARRGVPNLAQLTIRSGLLGLNSADSPLLNPVVNGLLGGNLSLNAMSWDKLLATDLSLMNYLDAIIGDDLLHLGLDAGDYESVLNAPISVGKLAEITADALNKQGVATAAVASGVISNLNLLKAATGPLSFTLGELLGVQAGTPVGTDVTVNVLEMIQGGIQLANGTNAVDIQLPANIPGVGGVSLTTKIIEPQQSSAIGDPAQIGANPDILTDKSIYVRSAQTRAFIDVNLQGLQNTISALLDILNSLSLTSSLMTSLMKFLDDNNSLGIPVIGSVLDLVGGVLDALLGPLLNGLGSLLSGTGNIPLCGGSKPACNDAKAAVLYAELGRFQIGVEAAKAEAWVAGFSCSGSKSLDTKIKPAVAEVAIGKINKASFLGAGLPPAVDPALLLDIGYRTARPVACVSKCNGTLLGLCTGRASDCGTAREYEPASGSTWTTDVNTAKKRTIVGARLKIGDGPNANRFTLGQVDPLELEFKDPLDVGEDLSDDDYQKVSAKQTVGSVATALTGVTIETFSDVGGLVGAVLSGVPGILNTLITPLRAVIANTLAQPLDSLVNTLLNLLGANLANAQLAGQLTCGADGVRLVR